MYGTRNLIQLKVGQRHTIELQLHLRTCDIKWFNVDAKSNISQIFSLVSKSVMPEVLNNDEEIPYNKGGSSKGKKPTVKSNQNSKGIEKKRKATSKDTEAKAGGKNSKSQKLKQATTKKDETKKTYLSTMETKYLFADSIQISYRVSSVQNSNRAVLTFEHEEKVEDEILSILESLRPLPKIILAWCYPFDPLNPKLPIMDTTDGFPRTEFLPLSTLFKES
jgi:hypothetical protein